MWFRFSLSFSFSLKFRRSCCRILCVSVYLCVRSFLSPTTKKTRALPRTKKRAILRVTFCFSVFLLFCFSHAWLPYGCLFVYVSNFDRFTSCLLRCCCRWLLCFVFGALLRPKILVFCLRLVNPLCQREKSCPQNNLLLFF